MATNTPPKADDKAKTDADIKAEREAATKAAAQSVEDGADATEEARKQSAEVLKEQEEMRPYPSQEEADAMKSTAASGAAPYATRQTKA